MASEIYVIYKPRLGGVFHKYMTQVRSQRKFATDKPLAQTPSPKGEGFICGKLPMTEDKGRSFVEYTALAMVLMIYTMEMSY